MREGKLTLPMIHALAHLADRERRWLIELIQARTFTSDQFERLIALLAENQSIAYTRDSAQNHIARAKAALSEFSDSIEYRVLTDIADYALLRTA